MTNSNGNSENVRAAKTDEYYEELACQEEVYLERIEENLRAIAIRELDAAIATEKFEAGLECAVEKLVEGDGDDAPLGEEAIGELGTGL